MDTSSLSLPDSLSGVVNEALAAVRASPSHRFAPHQRQAVYAALSPVSDSLNYRVRAWLAIITARRVLPIFQQALPLEEMPRRLIDLAEAVVQGKLAADSMEVKSYADQSYHRMSSARLATMPWPVHLAAYAARKALLEACGIEPLSDLDECCMYTFDGDAIPGSEWTDEDLCLDEAGDAASAAAVASAADTSTSFATTSTPACEPAKLLEFWEWWLTEAVPAAWAHA